MRLKKEDGGLKEREGGRHRLFVVVVVVVVAVVCLFACFCFFSLQSIYSNLFIGSNATRGCRHEEFPRCVFPQHLGQHYKSNRVAKDFVSE